MRARTVAAHAALALAMLAGAAQAGAAAPSDSTATAGADSAAAPAAPSDSVAAAPAREEEALSTYLGELSARTNQDFLLDQLSVSDAQVDSMIRAYEASGGESAVRDRGPGGGGWTREVGIAGARFNRVEGLNVLGQARIGVPSPHGLDLFGTAGYGWSAKEPVWRGGVRAGVGRGAELTVAHHREVWAYGAGGVPGNSLLALGAGRDEQDYFRGEGVSAQLALPHAGPMRAALTFTAEDQESQAQETDFTLFHEGSRFRVNPPVEDGRLHRMELAAGAGDRAEGAWAVDLRGAASGGALGGDFDYGSGGGSVLLRRRVRFGDEAKLRLDGGFVTGDAPYQSLYFLGGAQRLRGYGINEFPARGAVHAALDYKLGTNPLRFLPYLRRLKLQPVPFADAAAIFATQGPDGERVTFDTPEWRFDAGIGLQYNVLGIPGGSGQIRLDFAWRLDRGENRDVTRLGFTVAR